MPLESTSANTVQSSSHTGNLDNAEKTKEKNKTSAGLKMMNQQPKTTGTNKSLKQMKSSVTPNGNSVKSGATSQNSGNIISLTDADNSSQHQPSLSRADSQSTTYEPEYFPDIYPDAFDEIKEMAVPSSPKTPEKKLLEDLNKAGLNFDTEQEAMDWVKTLDVVLQQKIDTRINTRAKGNDGDLEMTGKMKSDMNSYTSQDPLTKDRSDFSRYANEVDDAVWTLAVANGGVRDDHTRESPSFFGKLGNKAATMVNKDNEDERYFSEKQTKTALTQKVSAALKNYHDSLNIQIQSNPDDELPIYVGRELVAVTELIEGN